MKTLVLFSGGLDSTVLLAKAVMSVGADNVIALNIYYGQKHAKEMESAKFQCEWYGVQLISVDLASVFSFDASCPLLEDSVAEMPEESYAEQLAKIGGQGTVITYVPFRNGLFLSYATTIALQLKVDTILYGAHADDAAGRAYPDCTPEFIFAMQNAILQGTGKEVHLEAPFKDMNKADIVRQGLKLGVDFSHTWSCYNGKDLPCGKCGTCIDRIHAFQDNDMIDPLILKTVEDKVRKHAYETAKCNICGKPIAECDRN